MIFPTFCKMKIGKQFKYSDYLHCFFDEMHFLRNANKTFPATETSTLQDFRALIGEKLILVKNF